MTTTKTIMTVIAVVLYMVLVTCAVMYKRKLMNHLFVYSGAVLVFSLFIDWLLPGAIYTFVIMGVVPLILLLIKPIND